MQIKKSKSERVIESLRGTWQAEHLFALRQAMNAWDFYQAQIRECDQQIEQVLHELGGPPDEDNGTGKRGGKPGGTNTPAHPRAAPHARAVVRAARTRPRCPAWQITRCCG